MSRKLDKIFETSQRLCIDDNTKLVIMSDCHRGAGDNYDNFIKNQSIYEVALLSYYKKGFTYIELGDGDDMWEVKRYENIINVHLDIFKQIKKFKDDDRLIMIYGNHDILKRKSKILEKYFYKYYDKNSKKDEDLLNDIVVYESLILNYKNHDIFLLHGHQADFFNSNLWQLSRFLVHYFWKSLEFIGFKDPTSAAKNYKVMKSMEKKLTKWSIKRNKILIAGHTHRAVFPQIGQSLYFNDGSCIHPNGITCLEIENGNIALVKWNFKVDEDDKVFVERTILAGEESIINFYKK